MNILICLSAVVVFASASEFDKCSWGESYWCSHIRTAKECGAVKHCIDTIWKHDTPPEDPNQNGEICDYCKQFIGDVRDFISSKSTQEQVKQYLDQACGMIPVPEVAKDCQDIVDKNLPEIFQLIESELDPQKVCSAMGLCAKFKDMVHHPQLRLENAKMNLKKSPLFKLAQSSSVTVSAECDLCKVIMKELQTLGRDHGVQDDTKWFLKSNICAHLATLKDACDATVDEFATELFELLVNELDPDTRCTSLGFCSMKGEPKIKSKAPVTSGVTASVECVMCEFVIDKLISILKDNRTEPAIEDALDKVCGYLPASIKTECEEFVNTYTPVIVELLEQELDPTQVCTTLGLCKGSTRKAAVSLIKLSGGEACGICETVVQYIDSLLEMNSTVQELEKVLEKVCNFLPESLQAQCDDFVKLYGPDVIKLLAQYADPQEVCTALKLCSYNVNVEKPVVPEKASLLGEKECTYGPAFWCKNMDNAKKCNAISHCKKHVWKN